MPGKPSGTEKRHLAYEMALFGQEDRSPMGSSVLSGQDLGDWRSIYSKPHLKATKKFGEMLLDFEGGTYQTE
jgi:hypothetical protein